MGGAANRARFPDAAWTGIWGGNAGCAAGSSRNDSPVRTQARQRNHWSGNHGGTWPAEAAYRPQPHPRNRVATPESRCHHARPQRHRCAGGGAPGKRTRSFHKHPVRGDQKVYFHPRPRQDLDLGRENKPAALQGARRRQCQFLTPADKRRRGVHPSRHTAAQGRAGFIP
ncbi:hypothetical protein D3C72_1832770 [compost metagenome]